VSAYPNVEKEEGGGLTDTRSVTKADRSEIMMYQKGPTVLAKYREDSAIPENSPTGDNYITDRS